MHYPMAPYLFQHVVVKCRVVVFIIVLVNPGVSTDKVMRVKGFYSLNTIKFGSPLTRRDQPRDPRWCTLRQLKTILWLIKINWKFYWLVRVTRRTPWRIEFFQKKLPLTSKHEFSGKYFSGFSAKKSKWKSTKKNLDWF